MVMAQDRTTDERLQIAKNGYEKVKRYHTYDTRLTEILNTVISD